MAQQLGDIAVALAEIAVRRFGVASASTVSPGLTVAPLGVMRSRTP